MLTCFTIRSTELYTLQHIFTCLRAVTCQRSKVKSKAKFQRSKVKGQVKGQVKSQVKGQRSKVKGQRSNHRAKTT